MISQKIKRAISKRGKYIDRILFLPILCPYGTRIIFYIIFYQHLVPNGTKY
jgi:hypothetical protein